MKVAFVCPSCRTAIQAPPSLEGESAPCPKCNVDVDRWPAPVSSPGMVRVVTQPPPAERAMWYYSVNDTRRGPMTITQLKSLVESAVLRPNDLVWREGMPGWVEAGTIPELFPAGLLPAHAPPPTPPTATPDDETEEPRSRRDDREAIQVHVHQVVERDEERRPRRRRRGGFCCPYCGSRRRPYVSRQVSGAGWAVFVILLIFTIILCFIGLLIQEDVYHCSDCGARV